MTQEAMTLEVLGGAPQEQVAGPCEECQGTGGWLRYEPASEPEVGVLYLSCLQCRGSGRLALAA